MLGERGEMMHLSGRLVDGGGGGRKEAEERVVVLAAGWGRKAPSQRNVINNLTAASTRFGAGKWGR